MNQTFKEYWYEDWRNVIVMIMIMLVFLTMATFIYLKYDEVTHHPCEVCASVIGKNIVCTSATGGNSKTFEPFTVITKEIPI